jgi:hypothetical protein
MSQKYTLTWFVHDWEDSLNHPENLLFSMTVGTLAEYLLESTRDKQQIQKISYDRELLKLLSNAVKKSSPEIRILQKCKPSTIMGLLQEFPPQPPTQMIKKHLKGIHDAYRSDKFILYARNELCKLFFDHTKNDETRLITHLLLRALLMRFSSEFLKDLPQKIFSKIFYSTFDDEITKRIKNDKTITKEARILFKDLLEKSKSGAKTLSDEQKLKEFLNFSYYSGAMWQRDAYRLHRNFQFMLKKNQSILRTICAKKKIKRENILKKISEGKSRELMQKLALEAILKICFNTLFACVGDYMPTVRELNNHECVVKYSSIVKSVIDKKNEMSQHYNFNYDTAESAFWSYMHTTSNFVSEQIATKHLKYATTLLCTRLTDFLFNEISKSDKTHTKNLLSTSLDKFDFYRLVILYCRELGDKIIKDTIASILELKIQNLPRKTLIFFTQTQLEKIFIELNDKSNFSKIPDLSKKMTKHLLYALFDEILKPSQEFRIISLVGGMDCNEKILKIGDITFYDPRVWEFGEGDHFDSHPGAPISLSENFRTIIQVYEKAIVKDYKIERKRNSARAYVDVYAYDEYSAIGKSELSIKKAIDALVYASSAKANLGFKPQMPVDFVITHKNLPYSGSTTGPRTHNFDMLKIDEDYDKIAKFYHKLIQDPPSFSYNLLRAIEWYHRGHWADTPNEKYVSHWIALEQLVLGQLSRKAKSEELLKFVPKLTTYWSKGFSSYGISVYFKEITKNLKKGTKLSKFLDATPEFQGWQNNYFIILEHLDLLEPVTRGEVKRCVQLLKNELSEQRIQEFKNTVRMNRSQEKFRIALLKAKRNSLIHEGTAYSPELPIMTKVLEKILVDVIDAHLRFNYAKNMKKIIYEINRPIHVKDTKF